MKSLKKIAHLADIFELKLRKFAQDVSQAGTTELFFENEGNQAKFANNIQMPNGPVHNVLLKYYEKTNGKPASFDLKINATPKKGAAWILTVNPPALTAVISKVLDAEFQKVVGQSMKARQQVADAKAKAGAGTGPNNQDVGSLVVE